MVTKLSQAIRYIIFAAVFGLLFMTAAQGESRGPIKVTTNIGPFMLPRDFVAIDLWRTLKIPPFETNYFVFRLPSKYAEAKIAGFTAIENHFEQEVIVTVEVLTQKRLANLKDINSQECREAAHDLFPESVPYQRCEYRKHFSSDGIAIKYHLNGVNNQYYREVGALILKKIREWKVS